jgi:hypothetical protein
MTARGISSRWSEEVSKAKRKTQRRPTPAAGATAEARRAGGGTISGGGEFKPDYTFVVKDLKRIGLLAGSLILGLIILSFFLK